MKGARIRSGDLFSYQVVGHRSTKLLRIIGDNGGF